MTTETELRHLLEMAAMACALEVKCTGENYNGLTLWVRDSSDCPWFPWAPHTDDCDSARMRSALGICTNWIWYVMNGEHKCVGVECTSPFSRAIDVYLKDHNNDRNAALRLCALRVAAMIGENIK